MVIRSKPGPAASKGGDHFGNFIGAVRNHKPSDLNAEIEEGAISYRLGRALHFDEKTFRCTGDPEAAKMFTRDYRTPFVVPKLV
jgi:hypothetical protein